MHRMQPSIREPQLPHLQTRKSDKTNSLGLRSICQPSLGLLLVRAPTHNRGWGMVTSSQGASHLLKFTTPLGMPVGVLKAGSSFSPSLMAFTRNTCGERSKGTECELGAVVPLTVCCSQGWVTGLGRGTAVTEPGWVLWCLHQASLSGHRFLCS